MKKIACLSALAAVLAFTAGTSVAATSTVTGGYAQSDAQGQMNKMGGFNLKYRYEEDNSPLGVIGSFTYTEKSRTASSGDYSKNQYYGITAGPAYRINDWASIYGVVGVGYGKFQTTEYPDLQTRHQRLRFLLRCGSAVQPDGKRCSGLLLRAEPYS